MKVQVVKQRLNNVTGLFFTADPMEIMQYVRFTSEEELGRYDLIDYSSSPPTIKLYPGVINLVGSTKGGLLDYKDGELVFKDVDKTKTENHLYCIGGQEILTAVRYARNNNVLGTKDKYDLTFRIYLDDDARKVLESLT